jgi:hypothetical protein
MFPCVAWRDHRAPDRVLYTHESGEIGDYAVEFVPRQGAELTIRVCGGAHGVNNMHRHTRSRGADRNRRDRNRLPRDDRRAWRTS